MDEEKELQDNKKRIEERVELIEKDPEKVIQDKLDKINYFLNRVGERTKPIKKGNKTMWQHLNEKKSKWEDSKTSRDLLDKEKQKLENQLIIINQKIKDVR